ncbi:MAG: primosomal protein N', partial [Clostridiales bacterium]|nr:primosomal protein N' [Clostridiales bacterium]
MPKHKYAAVVVNRKAKAVDKIFHYSVPEPLQDSLVLGSVVSIPFGKNNQKLEGVVVDFPDAPGLEVLKEINGPVSSMPLFTPRMIELSRWLADHYLCPWVAALQAMLPAGLLLTGVLPVFSQAYCCYIKDPSARTMMTEKQRAAWDHLSAHPGAGVKEVLELGITRNVLQGMEKKGLIAINDGCYAKDPSARTMMTEKQRAAWDHLSAHPGADIKELLALGVARDVLQGMEKKGLLTIKKERVIKESGHEPVKKAALNQEQEEVFRAVMDERGRSGHKRPVLLHGVTGSGKTEIYLRLIEQVIAEGRQAILLVPEIALTPQMVNFVRRRIAQGVAVLHSGMSEAERRLAWQEISEGRRQVVLGARSAVFAPLPRLGLIIMDEEHEPSYKQENVPRFHAREVALQRCRLEDALFLAGSATPSVETYYHAKKGRWLLLELKKRFHRAPPPETRVVDMREELREGNRS